jgi:hypothetical protein
MIDEQELALAGRNEGDPAPPPVCPRCGRGAGDYPDRMRRLVVHLQELPAEGGLC